MALKMDSDVKRVTVLKGGEGAGAAPFIGAARTTTIAIRSSE